MAVSTEAKSQIRFAECLEWVFFFKTVRAYLYQNLRPSIYKKSDHLQKDICTCLYTHAQVHATIHYISLVFLILLKTCQQRAFHSDKSIVRCLKLGISIDRTNFIHAGLDPNNSQENLPMVTATHENTKQNA